MAAGVTIKHKRKTSAFTGGDLAAGEFGINTTNGDVYISKDGTTVTLVTGGVGAPEGTAILSTGETGGNKVLTEDGDGTSSWQAPSGGGGSVNISATNDTGVTIPEGSLVYSYSDGVGGTLIGLAKSDDLSTLPAIGYTTADIIDTASGEVQPLGLMTDLDTSAFVDEDTLWVSETVAGEAQNYAPATYAQRVGECIYGHATAGVVLISPDQTIYGGADAGEGAVKFLRKVTASSDTTIQLLDLVTSDYDIYVFYFDKVLPDTDIVGYEVTLLDAAGVDVGGTYKTGFHYAGVDVGGGGDDTNVTGTNGWRLNNLIGNVAGEGCSGKLEINLSDASYKDMWYSNMVKNNSGQKYTVVGGGNNADTTEVKGVEFSFTSGNISGVVTALGIKNS